MHGFVLYSTLGCHLCEQAKAMLIELNAGVQWEEVEIAESDALIETYGVRIPVIKSQVTQAELGWPFDEVQLAAWLRQQEASAV